MSEFRNRGLRVVVDTTIEAEWRIASLQVPSATVERFAKVLKTTPFSVDDLYFGLLRIRQIDDWDVGFTISQDEEVWVITIWTVELPKQLEAKVRYLLRAGYKSLPEPVQVLLEGRRKE